MKNWILAKNNGLQWCLVESGGFDDWDESRGCSADEPTVEQLADWMDSEAENANAHDFVMTHRALAVILTRTIGREQTRKVLLELAEWDGLPGLTGSCGVGPGADDFRKRFGVDVGSWSEWRAEQD